MSIQRLLLFVGEEKEAGVGRLAAEQDLVVKLQNGLPPLFYQDIPYMPVYAAAGDEIRFGFVLANGTVRYLHLKDLCDLHCSISCVPLSSVHYLLIQPAGCEQPAVAIGAPQASPLSTQACMPLPCAGGDGGAGV